MAALSDSPVDCRNRRGFSGEKRIHLPPPNKHRSFDTKITVLIFECAYRLDSANRKIVVCRVPIVGAWCVAQRIKITMIAGGNHTIIPYQPPAAFRL